MRSLTIVKFRKRPFRCGAEAHRVVDGKMMARLAAKDAEPLQLRDGAREILRRDPGFDTGGGHQRGAIITAS